MSRTGNSPKQSKQSRTRPVPGSHRPRASDERRALRHCWHEHRAHGPDAVAAVVAERISRDRIAERTGCSVEDPVAQARLIVVDGLRRGWLNAA